jgi:protocatechuate 3,4-dioxygenase beta subunit
MCHRQPADIGQHFMRGVQTTDAAGTVLFDTCFPGWYRGRVVHIHFQVERGAAASRISQLFFPEAVTSAIFASHIDYWPYGQPDTGLATDSVLAAVPPAERHRHMLTIARMSDGAMLASQVVTLDNPAS